MRGRTHRGTGPVPQLEVDAVKGHFVALVVARVEPLGPEVPRGGDLDHSSGDSGFDRLLLDLVEFGQGVQVLEVDSQYGGRKFYPTQLISADLTASDAAETSGS